MGRYLRLLWEAGGSTIHFLIMIKSNRKSYGGEAANLPPKFVHNYLMSPPYELLDLRDSTRPSRGTPGYRNPSNLIFTEVCAPLDGNQAHHSPGLLQILLLQSQCRSGMRIAPLI